MIDKATDPSSDVFNDLVAKLLAPAAQSQSRPSRLRASGQFKYTLPYKVSPELEYELLESTQFKFPDKGVLRNGGASLTYVLAEMAKLVTSLPSSTRTVTTLVASRLSSELARTLATEGSLSPQVRYTNGGRLADDLVRYRPDHLIVDHTTLNMPIDDLHNLAYLAGVKVIDGVFPYHVAAHYGWDVVTPVGKWSYTFRGNTLWLGPDDDPSRVLLYDKREYIKFVEPSAWNGRSKQYLYEIRSYENSLMSYRSVYVGDAAISDSSPVTFKLPMCSSDDMVLVTINKQLAAGTFAFKSNNAQDIASAKKDYCIEVRRDLFVSTVEFLMAKEKGADIIGDSIRYMTAHNWVDLVDGVRIVRCASLKYADLLCVAMVACLTAYQLRYRITNEVLPDLVRTVTSAKLALTAPLGFLGRIAYLAGSYVHDAASKVYTRGMDKALNALYTSEHIPGLCFDLYMDKQYIPDAPWATTPSMVVDPSYYEPKDDPSGVDDPFVEFMGEKARTYAPTVFQAKGYDPLPSLSGPPYQPNPVKDPTVVVQEYVDKLTPGASTIGLSNVTELRKVKDINFNTEFYGKIEIAKDVKAPEKLHDDMPIRTGMAAPTSSTLVDGILASAKRNFNPPDMQTESDPWKFADYLVRKFIRHCFVPNYHKTIGKAYVADPITFNTEDYLEWLAGRGETYKKALYGECPEGMVELGLNKFDTMIKSRIKPKLDSSVTRELGQPQVIVSSSKKDTALFSSVFRKVFERFDNALRPEFKSAGRSSDDDISEWLTAHRHEVVSLPSVEIDSSKYDKSQLLLARMIEAAMFVRLGLDPQVSKIYEDSFVGKVSSRSVGLAFVIAYQMKSGAPDTMLGNMIYNFVTSGESVGYENIALGIYKGDDNVLWLKPTATRDFSRAVEKMSGLFNLEVKLVQREVPYFSSGYFIPLGEEVVFAPDPSKLAVLLGEPGGSSDTLRERFVSFCDRVRSLTARQGLPHALQLAVRYRTKCPELDVVGLVDALCALASSFEVYSSVRG